MAIVHKHDTLRERAEKVPLITQKARTTDVTALDEDRSDEVRCAMADLLRKNGREDLIGEGDPCSVDWEGVEGLVDDVRGFSTEQFRRLRGRFERPHPSLISVELRPLEEDVAFVPGQFISVKFCGTPRAYSVASSPNDDVLRFCIRRVPGGRLTPQLCDGLSGDDEVTIRGPNGEFVLSEPSERDVAFLATGTGTAPFRSMIDYIFEEGRDVYEGTNVTRQWHIDYLLGAPASRWIHAWTAQVAAECEFHARLPGKPIEGIGATDWYCSSHLLYNQDRTELVSALDSVYETVTRD